jgi:sugar phosphate isomerase/epimerase
MGDPKIYLAIDNCFASKRWTRPAEWGGLIRDLGVYFIEASADNECDPLYTEQEYLEGWLSEVKECCRNMGIKVSTLYSGHGTYSTLGLSHTSPQIRDKIQNEWLKPMASLAAEVDAELGFFCHAFSEATLQDPNNYEDTLQDLYKRLGNIAYYCRKLGMRTPSVEQMYTPHQIPWTLDSSRRLLQEVYRLSQSPLYLTIDTGHQSGQRKFLRPSEQSIREKADEVRKGRRLQSFWLGPKTAYSLFDEMVERPLAREDEYIEKILLEIDRFPYLFAQPSDGDTFLWLSNFGCYSPIVHLQQTDGLSSSHQPFTDECNAKGTIFGDKLLQAINKSYTLPHDENMPPKCEEIYLTLEIFSGTSEHSRDIIKKMKDSVDYWRQFIPEDGMKLSEALQLLNQNPKK